MAGMTNRFRASLLMTVSFALAACGGSAPPPSPSPSGAQPASVAPAKPAVSAAAPASAKPAAASASASAKPAASAGGAPIKIGLDESLTGSFATIGKDNQDGFNLYLDSIGNTIAGRKVQVVTVDDAGRPDQGLTKAKQLVESDNVDLIAGVHVSPVCNALVGYVKDAHVPLAITGNCPNENLMTDPKIKNPYTTRFSEVASATSDVAADWAYKNGYRKATMMINDIIGGIELGDAFASAFIKRGGSVVQEQYAALGTADFGPFLAQLDPQADLILVGEAGADGLRFGQQMANYVGGRKLQVVDILVGPTSPASLDALKDKMLGAVGSEVYCQCIDSPANTALAKAWQAKYPGRVLSTDVAQGWSGAQIVDAAIKKLNGDVSDKAKLAEILRQTNVDTAKGPVKLDQDSDLVSNNYVYQVVKQGSGVGYKLLDTYKDIGRGWDRTPDELAKFPFGKMKGKWTGMTKAKLDQVIATGNP
jgi:branched-chain amino acid transport system substrate-binding protein